MQQYVFKFTANKIAVILIIGFLSFELAGRVTKWLYEHDVFIVLCFLVVLWGFSYFPVWVLDWVLFRLQRFIDGENDRAGRVKKTYTDYDDISYK